MSILEKNLKLLDDMDLAYRKEIEKVLEDGTKFEMEIADARDGAQAVIVSQGGRQIRLNSTYQPLKEAKRWADQYEFQNLQVNIIMFGLGNGIFVKEILSRMGDDAKLFIYEPDCGLLAGLMEKIDYGQILSHSQVQLILGSLGEENFQNTLYPSMNWVTIPSQIVCSHPGYDKLYKDEMDWYQQRLRRMRDMARVSRNTNAYFSHLTLENAIPNLRHVKGSNHLGEFADCLDKDTPVIIVSAGPSLDKNMKMLERAKNKAVILAVDTAVRHLEKNNIEYDCMVTIDPEKPEEYFSDAPGCKEIPLVCGMASNHKMLEFHEGRKIWAGGDVILTRIYNRHGIETSTAALEAESGGSVATLALIIAMCMGSRKIILVGQDLAYGEQGSHAGGEHSDIQGEKNQNIWVDGIDGNPVKTRWDWNFFKDWFEDTIRMKKDLELIDATEGGALIHGSKVMTLADAIEEYCVEEIDFKKMVRQTLPTFNEKEYEEIRKDILHIEKEMQRIYDKVTSGITSCEEYLEHIDHITRKRHDELVKEIGKVNRFIMLQEGASEILDIYTSDLAMSDLAELNLMTGDSKQDEINSVQNAKVIYSAYKTGAKDLLAMLTKSLKNV